MPICGGSCNLIEVTETCDLSALLISTPPPPPTHTQTPYPRSSLAAPRDLAKIITRYTCTHKIAVILIESMYSLPYIWPNSPNANPYSYCEGAMSENKSFMIALLYSPTLGQPYNYFPCTYQIFLAPTKGDLTRGGPLYT